jgi:hypothetical protein
VTTCLAAMEAGKFEVLYKENVLFMEGREKGFKERPKKLSLSGPVCVSAGRS